MSNKARWANILCNQDMKPFKLIVTDGKTTSEIPVSNSSLETVKRAARDVYSVPKKQILVSQIFN